MLMLPFDNHPVGSTALSHPGTNPSLFIGNTYLQKMTTKSRVLIHGRKELNILMEERN